MKKISLIIAAALIIASLSGCDTIKKAFSRFGKITLGDKISTDEHGDRSSFEGASITRVSNTRDSLTVKIFNGTASTWQSGNMKDYSLEAEKDGAWYSVKQIGEFANTMELMIFAPGQRMTHTFKFSERYGELIPGKYRVVKSFWANATETNEAREFHLICEFTVE